MSHSARGNVGSVVASVDMATGVVKVHALSSEIENRSKSST